MAMPDVSISRFLEVVWYPLVFGFYGFVGSVLVECVGVPTGFGYVGFVLVECGGVPTGFGF